MNKLLCTKLNLVVDFDHWKASLLNCPFSFRVHIYVLVVVMGTSMQLVNELCHGKLKPIEM